MGTQHVEFDIPFSPRINSGWQGAHERHLGWVRRLGLVRAEAGIRRYARWRPADLSALWFPHAPEADLDLGSDVFGWFLLFDDQFEDARGDRPDTVRSVIAEVERVLVEAPAGRPSPAAAALADIWARERHGMSQAWQRRAARNWREFLATYVDEAVNRERKAELTVEDYMRLRDKSGVMYVLLDLVERVGRFEVPDAVARTPQLRSAYDMAVQVINVVNDVHSLDKEEKRGDLHNLVLVLEREQVCGRAEAISRIQAMVRDWTDRFLRAEAELPRACDDVGLPAADRVAVYRFAEGMRAAIRGNYDWCASTVRYSLDDVPPQGRPAYIEDIVATS